MRLPMYLPAVLVLVACVLINCAFWGGVASSRVLGPVVPEALRLQAPLAYTWLLVGEAAGSAIGMQERLAGFAERLLGDLAPLLESRSLAAERVLDARPGWLKLLHSLPLVLLPLALLLWWRRPRGFKTFSSR